MNEDYYVFSMEEEVLKTMEVLRFDETAAMVEELPKQESPTEHQSKEIQSGSLSQCTTCKVDFSGMNQGEKKDHYKSDFHRLNIKRGLNGMGPINEEEFDAKIETQSLESISGSESEESEPEKSDSEDSESENPLSDKLLEKLAIGPLDLSPEHNVSHMNTNSPFILFGSSLLPSDERKAFGIYKALFTKKTLSDGRILEELPLLSRSPVSEGKSVLLMIGGGHFAGAVVSHKRKNTRGNVNHNESKLEQMVDVVASKTFHRYTTRRKQGGSQSASDNSRGKANSAGSSIRRYNEVALQQEVRELLNSWRHHLDNAQFVFIRANAAANRKSLVGYENAPLAGNDLRIRNFPFTTKRPTLAELKRAWVKLACMDTVELPKATKEQQKQRQNQNTTKQPEKLKNHLPAPRDLDPAESHTTEITSLLKKSKAPLMISYLRKNGLDGNFKFAPSSHHTNAPTPLHYAASHGLLHMVQILLVNLKADPTILNAAGKTPCQVSSSDSVKKTFQVARHILGELYTDWTAAKVGPPMTKEDVSREEEEIRKHQQQERLRLVEAELANKTELELKKPSFSSGGTLGGSRVQSQTAEVASLTDQQRARLMREQRARAAEARLRKS